ncbi:hypothetical protein [Lysobacter gummosus]|uniref:hypothetical protein n=1 Tax=Lysobacter gummosus TaxID=262324 RepID=UPI0036255569
MTVRPDVRAAAIMTRGRRGGSRRRFKIGRVRPIFRTRGHGAVAVTKPHRRLLLPLLPTPYWLAGLCFLLPLPLAGEGWGEGMSAVGANAFFVDILRQPAPHPNPSPASGRGAPGRNLPACHKQKRHRDRRSRWRLGSVNPTGQTFTSSIGTVTFGSRRWVNSLSW